MQFFSYAQYSQSSFRKTFFFFFNNSVQLCIFGHAGSSLLLRPFSSCSEIGPLFLAVHGPQNTDSKAVAHRLSCSTAYGILPDQGLNPHPLHQSHQGSTFFFFFCLPEGTWKTASAQEYTTLRTFYCIEQLVLMYSTSHTNAHSAKSLHSCPTLCDPIDGSPPGSPGPGILQARTLEQVAISFSNAWKWKVKVKSLSRV